jgi:hypothetical protein
VDPEERTLVMMTNETAQTAHLWKVAEAIADELARQGVARLWPNEGTIH